ncbi:MAG: ABC transporter permease [Solirubrobacterales bacterium]|nr:ABC transporter permease [Solirubrobacterales bacterium]
MSSAARRAYFSSAWAVAWRYLHNLYTKPAVFVPGLIFPLFFLAAFAGGLSSVSDVPGFDYYDFTAFQFCFVLIQASALAGVFVGFSIAGDFEQGMGRRMMLATSNRSAIVLGYALGAALRLIVVWVIITGVSLLAGMTVRGSGLDIAGMYMLGLLANVAALFFSAGIALRFRSLQAGPLMQMPVFIILFLAPVYVPQELLTGWIEPVAKVNPVTALLDGARSLLAGEPTGLLLAYGVAFSLIAVMAVWAMRGLRKAEVAG